SAATWNRPCIAATGARDGAAMSAPRPRQLPLELGHAPGHSRDELVVSPANAAAVALVERWPDWPAPVVVLAGPPGSGKTHLASIWREAAYAAAVTASDLSGAGLPAEPAGPI